MKASTSVLAVIINRDESRNAKLPVYGPALFAYRKVKLFCLPQVEIDVPLPIWTSSLAVRSGAPNGFIKIVCGHR